MWLITTTVAAILVSAVWAYAPKKYKLGSLALMLWGLSIMVFIDRVLGYGGGSFIETETRGLIQNGIVLGIAMLMPAFIFWGIQLAASKIKRETTAR